MRAIRNFIQRRPVLTLFILLALGLGLFALIGYLRRGGASAAYRPVREAIAALQAGDVAAAMQSLSPHAWRGRLSREALEDLARREMQLYGPPRVLVTRKEIRLSGRRATCELNVLSFPAGGRRGHGRAVRSQWLLELEQAAEWWHIVDVQPIMIDGRPVDGLDSLPELLM